MVFPSRDAGKHDRTSHENTPDYVLTLVASYLRLAGFK